jgi:hypothetical protein
MISACSIRCASLFAGNRSLGEERLLFEHRWIAVHQVRESSKIILIQKGNGELRLHPTIGQKNTKELRQNRTHCAFDPEILNDTPPIVKKYE